MTHFVEDFAEVVENKGDHVTPASSCTALVKYEPANNNVPSKPKIIGSATDLDQLTLEYLEMLRYCRPHESDTEKGFVARFVIPLGGYSDKYGNRWITIPGNDEMLWSCHTDTVHNKGGIQKVVYGAGIATSDGNCLGADCTTGVWIMRQMIKRGIPGTYIFHRGEEEGGKGSKWIADNCKNFLSKFKFAIAFDRRGYSDVITYQMGRTASNECAKQISTLLGPNLAFEPCDGGIFTDTASYSHIIPECTNLSVGYFNQHTSKEFQNIGFMKRLLEQVCSVDWTQLVAIRDPNEVDDSWLNYRSWSNYDWTKHSKKDNKRTFGSRGTSVGYDNPYSDDEDDNGTSFYKGPVSGAYGKHYPRDLEDFVYHNPSDVAEFLECCGFTLEDLKNFKNEI